MNDSLLRQSMLLVAVVAFFADIGSAFSQSDVYLRIYDKTFQRMIVELHPFRGDAETDGRDLSDILANDLWMSGFFLVKKPTEGNDGSGAALAVIEGEAYTRGNQITVRPSVLDKASGRLILRNNYSDLAANHRAVMHRIADDIVFSLTGERGVANSKLAYVNVRSDGSKEIAISDYDGHNHQVLTSDGSINISPAWSSDGSKICFTTFKNDNADLYVYHLRSQQESRLSNARGLNTAPAWSPDDKRLCLTLSKDGNAELYLLDVERKKLRRLTYNNAIDSSPSWSPSNREIAFASDRTGAPQIYVMDADGLNVRRLTYRGSYNDTPAWSPRGDKIAFVSRTASGFDIYTIDVTGSNMQRLTDSSGANEDPSWSPNGFALIFSSNRTGKRQIFSMFWDGSDQRQITAGGENYTPAWSPRF